MLELFTFLLRIFPMINPVVNYAYFEKRCKPFEQNVNNDGDIIPTKIKREGDMRIFCPKYHVLFYSFR